MRHSCHNHTVALPGRNSVSCARILTVGGAIRLFLPVLGRPAKCPHAAVIPEIQILDLRVAPPPARLAGPRPPLQQVPMPRARGNDKARSPAGRLLREPSLPFHCELLPGSHVIRIAAREASRLPKVFPPEIERNFPFGSVRRADEYIRLPQIGFKVARRIPKGIAGRAGGGFSTDPTT